MMIMVMIGGESRLKGKKKQHNRKGEGRFRRRENEMKTKEWVQKVKGKEEGYVALIYL